jgi:hypothetical protein
MLFSIDRVSNGLIMEPRISVHRDGAVAFNSNPDSEWVRLRDVGDRLYIDSEFIGKEKGYLHYISKAHELKYGLSDYTKFTFTKESKQKLGLHVRRDNY